MARPKTPPDVLETYARMGAGNNLTACQWLDLRTSLKDRVSGHTLLLVLADAAALPQALVDLAAAQAEVARLRERLELRPMSEAPTEHDAQILVEHKDGQRRRYSCYVHYGAVRWVKISDPFPVFLEPEDAVGFVRVVLPGEDRADA